MKEQAEHVQKIIDEIATSAIALSPDTRPAFIKAEIAKVRTSFLQTMRRTQGSSLLLWDSWIRCMVR